MNFRVSITLGTIVACSISALPAQSATRSACQRLPGVDRAPDSNVKLVKRPTSARRLANDSRASKLVGCVLPRGPVRTLAVRKGVENGLAQEFGFAIRQVAGNTVLLDRHGTEGGYGSDLRTMVFDLASGRSYTIAHSCAAKDISCTPDYDYARRVIVRRDGRAVAALEHWQAGVSAPTMLIATFASDGKARLLDAGPPAELPGDSLTLTGNVASWSHAGQPRSADIRG